MKIKIFALMATMLLLMGTTAIAQSNNTKKETTERSTKGDVNGDGVVDVADIAAVIAVMHEQGTIKQKYYYYVGQTIPSSGNYTSLAKTSSTLLDSITYTTEARNYIYVLVPSDVKLIEVIDMAINSPWGENDYSLDTSISIPGCKVYKTVRCGAEATLKFKFN